MAGKEHPIPCQASVKRYRDWIKTAVVKRPRLDAAPGPHISPTDDFDENNPFTKGNYSDEIELKFDEGKSLFVSKVFLSFSSPVFTRMFKPGFTESNSSSVDLKGKSYDAFLDMLLFLHPRMQKPIPDAKAKVIYQIAHEYQIPTVSKRAETILLNQITSLNCVYNTHGFGSFGYVDDSESSDFLNKVFELLIFAETYNNESLLSAAAERISVLPMSRFSRHSSYSDILEATKILILMYRLERYDKDEPRNEKSDTIKLNRV